MTNDAETGWFGTLEMPPFLGALEGYTDGFCGQLEAVRELYAYSLAIDDAGVPVKIEIEEFRKDLSESEFEELKREVFEQFNAIEALRKNADPQEKSPVVRFGHYRRDPVGFAFAKIVRRVGRRMQRPSPGVVVRHALTGVLISEYELLLRRVARLVVKTFPECVGQPNEKLTLKEIRALSDVSEADDVVADRIVDKMLRGNLSHWQKWWKDFKFSYDRTVPDWELWRELYSRRHILVHNDGVVNEQYNDGVDTAYKKELGTKLQVSGPYLNDKIDEVQAAGILLCIQAAVKFDREDADKAGLWGLSQIVQSVEFGQPEVGRLIASSLGLESLHLSDTNKKWFKIFRWICHRDAAKLDEVLGEITAWDTSSLGIYEKCIREVLLENFDEAARLTGDLIASGLLGRESLASNLLFQPVAEQILARLDG